MACAHPDITSRCLFTFNVTHLVQILPRRIRSNKLPALISHIYTWHDQYILHDSGYGCNIHYSTESCYYHYGKHVRIPQTHTHTCTIRLINFIMKSRFPCRRSTPSSQCSLQRLHQHVRTTFYLTHSRREPPLFHSYMYVGILQTRDGNFCDTLVATRSGSVSEQLHPPERN